ncbi:hypothetical protein, partial [Actinosynnema sp. NPDC023926]|uniref:hypothetical protein n=1 Tax=Actinosynnema sp. NPDC023926 TaxID=3157196 RepID=UPI0033C55B63
PKSRPSTTVNTSQPRLEQSTDRVSTEPGAVHWLTVGYRAISVDPFSTVLIVILEGVPEGRETGQ